LGIDSSVPKIKFNGTLDFIPTYRYCLHLRKLFQNLKKLLSFCELLSFDFQTIPENPHRLIKMKHISKSNNNFFSKIYL
jgi:hypothetical protein